MSGVHLTRYLIKDRHGELPSLPAEVSLRLTEAKANPDSGWDSMKVVRAEKIWFFVFRGTFEYEFARGVG